MKKIKNNKLFISLIIFSISLCLFLVCFFRVDSDYLWHISAGEYMFKNGILKQDVFSWYTYSKYWMSHEWLFEIIIYLLKIIFGKVHVLIYSFITSISLLLILICTNKKNFLKNILVTFIYLFFFFLFLVNYLQCRPHMISFSLFALSVYLIYDLKNNEESKKIYFLPIISIIWANVHGGSSNMPYLLCLIVIISGLFKFKFKKIEAFRLSKLQIKKYLIIMLLCMISVCINIHGVKMFIYPYQNMANTLMINNISEWSSTTLSSLLHYEYFIFLLILILILLFSDKKIEFIDFILFGFVTYLGLKSVRFWVFTYIMMSYIIFNYVKEKRLDKGTILSINFISIMLLVIFFSNLKSTLNVNYNINLSNKFITIIKNENPKRLFNIYDFGGELIYNNISVFIDGRADLYSDYNYKDYLDITRLNSNYIKLINKYDFDYFLVNTSNTINSYLKCSSDYKVIYKEKDIIFYKKISN
jgi:hypothetical protein